MRQDSVCLVHSYTLRPYTVPSHSQYTHESVHTTHTVKNPMQTRVGLQLWRSNVGGMGGERSRELPRCQLLAATALWDSPAETVHGLQKHKALLHPCRAHAPALGVMGLRRPPRPQSPQMFPGPQSPQMFPGRGSGGGGGSLWAPSFVPGPSRI